VFLSGIVNLAPRPRGLMDLEQNAASGTIYLYSSFYFRTKYSENAAAGSPEIVLEMQPSYIGKLLILVAQNP
jgi:hypothetical protein